MALSVVTQEDLKQFKVELLSEIKDLVSKNLEKKWLKSHEVKDLLNIYLIKNN